MQKWLVGVDEAGRGPLAGPVSVAAFAIPHKTALCTQGSLVCSACEMIAGVKDSKQFTALQREEWCVKLSALRKRGDVLFARSFVSHATIDKKGITQAVRLGLRRSLEKLKLNPNDCEVRLDGLLKAPKEYKNQKTIIHGDALEPIISAASIVAKVTRDRLMKKLAKKYPEYGFEIHKGYGTKAHYGALKKLGPSEIHRKSFL